jgi:hypothetical protein
MNADSIKNIQLHKNKLLNASFKIVLAIVLIYLLVVVVGIVNHVVVEQKHKALLNDFRADAKIIAATYKNDKQTLPSWPASLDELVNGDTLREEFRTSTDSEYFYHMVQPSNEMAWSHCGYYIELQKNSSSSKGTDTVARIFSDDCSKQWLKNMFVSPFRF